MCIVIIIIIVVIIIISVIKYYAPTEGFFMQSLIEHQ